MSAISAHLWITLRARQGRRATTCANARLLLVINGYSAASKVIQEPPREGRLDVRFARDSFQALCAHVEKPICEASGFWLSWIPERLCHCDPAVTQVQPLRARKPPHVTSPRTPWPSPPIASPKASPSTASSRLKVRTPSTRSRGRRVTPRSATRRARPFSSRKASSFPAIGACSLPTSSRPNTFMAT